MGLEPAAARLAPRRPSSRRTCPPATARPSAPRSTPTNPGPSAARRSPRHRSSRRTCSSWPTMPSAVRPVCRGAAGWAPTPLRAHTGPRTGTARSHPYPAPLRPEASPAGGVVPCLPGSMLRCVARAKRARGACPRLTHPRWTSVRRPDRVGPRRWASCQASGRSAPSVLPGRVHSPEVPRRCKTRRVGRAHADAPQHAAAPSDAIRIASQPQGFSPCRAGPPVLSLSGKPGTPLTRRSPRIECARHVSDGR